MAAKTKAQERLSKHQLMRDFPKTAEPSEALRLDPADRRLGKV